MGDGLLNGGFDLLVRHFQEQQKRQLLNVIAVGKAVIPQDVAVIPKFLKPMRRVCSSHFALLADHVCCKPICACVVQNRVKIFSSACGLVTITKLL